MASTPTTTPTLVSLQSSDPVQARWQSSVLAALTPFLRRAAMAPQVYASSAVPTASASWDGRQIMVRDTAAASVFKICMRTSAGSYEWVTVATSS